MTNHLTDAHVSPERLEIKSTSKNGLSFFIDSADFELVSRHGWYVALDKRYDPPKIKAVYGYIDGKDIGLHRILMKPPAGMMVDHIDGNPLNNCRSNLRVCTHTENTRNQKKRRNLKYGFKGVFKSRKRFGAMIHVEGKPIYLGQYKTVEEAHSAYCAAAVKYHGEFARFE